MNDKGNSQQIKGKRAKCEHVLNALEQLENTLYPENLGLTFSGVFNQILIIDCFLNWIDPTAKTAESMADGARKRLLKCRV